MKKSIRKVQLHRDTLYRLDAVRAAGPVVTWPTDTSLPGEEGSGNPACTDTCFGLCNYTPATKQ